MADAAEVDEALRLCRRAFSAAKGKIARRTQVSSAVLKVMAGIRGDCLRLSVVIDLRHLSDELMEKFAIVSGEITASLRNALSCAGASLAHGDANAADSTPEHGAAAPTGEPGEGTTDPKASSRRPLLGIVTSASSTFSTSTARVDPNDMVAKRFQEGLLAIKRPRSLIVSLVANGKPDEAGSMKLVSRGSGLEQVRRREPKPQQMTGFVHAFKRSGTCRFKRDGATAQVEAEFATDDVVAMFLRLATDNPAVTIEYHQYKDASDRDVCIQITELIGLSAPWVGVTGAFANLARAVEALKKLLPKGRKQE